MKNLFLEITLMAIFSLVACAQKQKKIQIPKKVQTAFAQKFATAQKVKWGMEDKTEWEAEFKMNGRDYSTNFTTDGTWKETEYQIKKSEVPADVQAALDTNFADYKTEKIEVSETAGGKIFEFTLKKDNHHMEAVISDKGVVLKKEGQNEKDEENGKEEKNQDEDND